ncbi:DUF1203 domain-containing protein [Halovulum sp. GXIMD14793]
MTIRFEPLSTDWVTRIRAGGPDAYGHVAERATNPGTGAPCRHCLDFIPEGSEMLILAACPFPERQPYAETGPIFLCADCDAYEGAGVPPVLTSSPAYIVRGYTSAHRILYGTGKVVPQAEITAYCETLLTSPDIAYLHIRSATNNCYQVKVVRDDGGDT